MQVEVQEQRQQTPFQRITVRVKQCAMSFT